MVFDQLVVTRTDERKRAILHQIRDILSLLEAGEEVRMELYFLDHFHAYVVKKGKMYKVTVAHPGGAELRSAIVGYSPLTALDLAYRAICMANKAGLGPVYLGMDAEARKVLVDNYRRLRANTEKVLGTDGRDTGDPGYDLSRWDLLK